MNLYSTDREQEIFWRKEPPIKIPPDEYFLQSFCINFAQCLKCELWGFNRMLVEYVFHSH